MVVPHLDTLMPESYIEFRDNLKRKIKKEVTEQFVTLINTMDHRHPITYSLAKSFDRFDNKDDFVKYVWSIRSIQKIYDHQGYDTSLVISTMLGNKKKISLSISAINFEYTSTFK